MTATLEMPLYFACFAARQAVLVTIGQTYLLLEYAGREGFNGVEPCGMAALTCCPQMQSPKRATQKVPHHVELRVASTGRNTVGG